MDATASVYLLPIGSTNISYATGPDVEGYVRHKPDEYGNTNDAVWFNVSMTAPPYWNKNVPGLNFSSLWTNDAYATTEWDPIDSWRRSSPGLPSELPICAAF